MRVKLSDLDQQLTRKLLPVYLITGDEPFQLAETADKIRAAAREANVAERELFEAGPQFEWQHLAAETQSLSLFGDKRIIDLRVPGGKVGIQGGKFLKTYCESPPQDVLLLITMPKLDQKQLTGAWAKAIDRVGAIIQVWPLDSRQLTAWLRQRMRRAGISAGPEVVKALAEQVEGNLLSAAQEVEKLVLLHGTGNISLEQINGAVADCARFDVFELIDTALAGDSPHALRVLYSLRAEGTATAVVLWALARELRTLSTLLQALERGASLDQALTAGRIWQKRKPLYQRAIKRHRAAKLRDLLALCQKIDATIKGATQGQPWLCLEQVTLALAGECLTISSVRI